MEIEFARRVVKLRQWAEMVKACYESGKKVPAWCEENGISVKTFYYRLRVVRQEALKSADENPQFLPVTQVEGSGYPAFAELKVIGDKPSGNQTNSNHMPAVTITLGQMAIYIHNEAGPEVIAGVIKAAREITEEAYC